MYLKIHLLKSFQIYFLTNDKDNSKQTVKILNTKCKKPLLNKHINIMF